MSRDYHATEFGRLAADPDTEMGRDERDGKNTLSCSLVNEEWKDRNEQTQNTLNPTSSSRSMAWPRHAATSSGAGGGYSSRGQQYRSRPGCRAETLGDRGYR